MLFESILLFVDLFKGLISCSRKIVIMPIIRRAEYS